jgi:hypothetical protein
MALNVWEYDRKMGRLLGRRKGVVVAYLETGKKKR